MTSAEVEESLAKGLRERIDLYRQLKEQLRDEAERYRREGKGKLADTISESLDE